MARRRRRNNSSPEADLAALVTIGLAFAGYTKLKELSDENSYLVPIIMIVSGLLIALYVWWRVQVFLKARRADKAFTLANIDTMGGVEFEYYLAKLLRSRGYTNVRVTEKYDLGVDIVASKDGITWGIQAKRYKNPVKADAIRQVYTALTRYKCDRAMVITNSTFTQPAVELARDNKCALIDRHSLKKWVGAYNAS